ncbi:MAG: hypothetical protein KGL18_03805 [Burkholderiales bacterium]|nr:hypothetical protein [Burkholderiales bacterium]MDE1926007.1 hypothetical protein [Burkholderiales bacterium]MDE2161496.1 hypothetical protein [Burkholderiales bacterium]MDE2502091.1 hypothetical protein [Burkholderiales bacterium]
MGTTRRLAALLKALLLPQLGVGPAQALAAPPVAPASPAGPNASAPLEYRLGAGDVVRIALFQNLDLTLDGRIGDIGLL